MCGRYTLYSNSEDLTLRFGVDNDFEYQKGYNIAPFSENPVVVTNSTKKVVFMRWGLIPFWAKDEKIGYGLINARVEGIEEKPSFKKLIKSQRCLVPSNGFFEWKILKLDNQEEKVPFYFYKNDFKPFSYAGIYDVWKNKQNEIISTYAIITTKSQGIVARYHKRMPIILKEESEDEYLRGNTDLKNIFIILGNNDFDLEHHPVTREIGDPKNNSIELLRKPD